MQDSSDAVQDGCRTVQMQDSSDAVQNGCRTVQMQYRTVQDSSDAGSDGRTGWKQDMTDAGQDGCRTIWYHLILCINELYF